MPRFTPFKTLRLRKLWRPWSKPTQRYREVLCDSFIRADTIEIALHTPDVNGSGYGLSGGTVFVDGSSRAIGSGTGGHRFNLSTPLASHACVVRARFHKGGATTGDFAGIAIRAWESSATSSGGGGLGIDFEYRFSTGAWTLSGATDVSETWSGDEKVLELRITAEASGGKYTIEGMADGVVKISRTGVEPPPVVNRYIGFTVRSTTGGVEPYCMWAQAWDYVSELRSGEWAIEKRFGLDAASRVKRDEVTGDLWMIGEVAVNSSSASPFYVRRSTDNGVRWTAPEELAALRTTAADDECLLLYHAFFPVNNVLHVLINTAESTNGDLIYYQGTYTPGSPGTIAWSAGINLTSQMGGATKWKAHRGGVVAEGTYVHIINTPQFNAADRNLQYYRSTDGGASFANAVDLWTEAEGGASGCALTVDGLGGVHVVFSKWDGTGTPSSAINVGYRRNLKNGAPGDWETAQILEPVNRVRPNIVVKPPFAVIVCENSSSDPAEYVVCRAYSVDRGRSWTTLDKVTPNGLAEVDHNVTAVTPEGVVHVALRRTEESPPDNAIYFASGDLWGSGTWTNPSVVMEQTVWGDLQPFAIDVDASYVHILAAAPGGSTNYSYHLRRSLVTSTQQQLTARYAPPPFIVRANRFFTQRRRTP